MNSRPFLMSRVCGSTDPNTSVPIRPNKLTFLVLVSIPLKKWRWGANLFLFIFFKRGQIAGYSYAYKYVFNGV